MLDSIVIEPWLWCLAFTPMVLLAFYSYCKSGDESQ